LRRGRGEQKIGKKKDPLGGGATTFTVGKKIEHPLVEKLWGGVDKEHSQQTQTIKR